MLLHVRLSLKQILLYALPSSSSCVSQFSYYISSYILFGSLSASLLKTANGDQMGQKPVPGVKKEQSQSQKQGRVHLSTVRFPQTLMFI